MRTSAPVMVPLEWRVKKPRPLATTAAGTRAWCSATRLTAPGPEVLIYSLQHARHPSDSESSTTGPR